VKQGEGEIAELSRMVNDLFDRLSLVLSRERQFLANAAHALRTPLAILQAEVSDARNSVGDEEEKGAALANIAESVDHLGRTVEYLLSLARLDAGGDVAAADDMYLDDVVSGTVARLSRLAEARGVRIVWNRLEETPVRANPHVTDQIAQILFENAVQYGGSGSTVSISVHPVSGGFGQLLVEDDGPGLSEDDLAALFTPFARGSAARDGAVRGTGLGLAVARWLVQRSGGTITVDRLEPRGVRFTVSV
jgi:two-component system OmpR family sensor kinase